MEAVTELWAALQQYRQLLGLVGMFFGPAILSRIIRFIRGAPPGAPGTPPPPGVSPTLLALVAVQALYTLYSLIYRPYDVFTSHGLGIRAPVEVLRTKVLRGLPPLDESHPLVILLIRLNVLDVRYAYARWGHATFIRCAWCRAPAEFALAALPSVLAPYVTEAVILGALGWVNVPGSVERKRLFRPAAGWAIAAMLIAEIAARWAVEIRAPPGGDCLHLDNTIYIIRTVALFLVSLIYVLAPLPSDAESAEGVARTLESTLYTQRLTALARQVNNPPVPHRRG